ncbi:hypothetical protein UK12_13840 [Saccharothrix sp. ST-888]|nr:hypothetical protein UK12_13840 [Saccharothrix sp. ST-888]
MNSSPTSRAATTRLDSFGRGLGPVGRPAARRLPLPERAAVPPAARRRPARPPSGPASGSAGSAPGTGRSCSVCSAGAPGYPRAGS